MEQALQSGKELAAEEPQVRTWMSSHHWTLLSMLAHAFTVLTTTSPTPGGGERGPIPLTRTEIRPVFAVLATRSERCRRRHQARTRHSHYRRQRASLE